MFHCFLADDLPCRTEKEALKHAGWADVKIKGKTLRNKTPKGELGLILTLGCTWIVKRIRSSNCRKKQGRFGSECFILLLVGCELIPPF